VVMAAHSSRELWESAAVLRSVSCSAGGVDWGEVSRGSAGGKEGGRTCRLKKREGQSVCPAADCRQHVSWVCSPDLHPLSP